MSYPVLILKGKSLDEQLHLFLAQCALQVQEVITWPNQIQLQVHSYLSSNLPHVNYVTSVRSIVLREQTVLVVQDPERLHILPGGRIENGESFTQTLQRELLEETGWTVNRIHYLGFQHFHHLTPKPAAYRYPYPDFLQVIFCANVLASLPEAKELNGYESDAVFYSFSELSALSLPESERSYLMTALKRHKH